MNKKNGLSILYSISLVALLAVAIADVPPARASSNLLSAYFGASLGHADLRARDSALLGSTVGSLSGFDRGDFAYQLTAGVRGLELFGVEVDYFHLGSGSASPSLSLAPSLPPIFYVTTRLTSAHISQKGEAVFAMLYLPVPIVGVYVKAGVARLTTDLEASTVPPPCPLGVSCPATLAVTGAFSTTETTFAAGAGVQWKYGDWAIRGEYERFTALGEHPSLESIGATWWF